MLPSLLEVESCACDEIADGTGDGAFPGSAAAATRAPILMAIPAGLPSCISHSPTCIPMRMSMPSLLHTADDAFPASSDRTRRTIQGLTEKPVSRRVAFPSAEACKFATDECVVLAEKIAPFAVSQCAQTLGQADQGR